METGGTECCVPAGKGQNICTTIKINVGASREQPQAHELQGVWRSLWEGQVGSPLGLLLLLVYIGRIL